MVLLSECFRRGPPFLLCRWGDLDCEVATRVFAHHGLYPYGVRSWGLLESREEYQKGGPSCLPPGVLQFCSPHGTLLL